MWARTRQYQTEFMGLFGFRNKTKILVTGSFESHNIRVWARNPTIKMSAKEEELYRLVESFCTSDQIQDLLRTAKGHKDVRITAEKKGELVSRNLRTAVDAKAISPDQVYELIREAEENGGQHIFYFKPRTKAAAETMTLNSVGNALFGANWETKKRFPHIDTPANGFSYADLRKWNAVLKPSDWILKLYGRLQFERFTGVEKEEGQRLYKEFVRED